MDFMQFVRDTLEQAQADHPEKRKAQRIIDDLKAKSVTLARAVVAIDGLDADPDRSAVHDAITMTATQARRFAAMLQELSIAIEEECAEDAKVDADKALNDEDMGGQKSAEPDAQASGTGTSPLPPIEPLPKSVTEPRGRKANGGGGEATAD